MTFSDIEYGKRKNRTRRDELLKRMDEMLPWTEWLEAVRGISKRKERGRPKRDPELLLRMLLLQEWYGLSGTACEEAVLDSYAMRTFAGIDFISDTVPDATTLCRFRRTLEKNGVWDRIEKDMAALLAGAGFRLRRGERREPVLARNPSAKKRTKLSEGEKGE